jgi:para-aminobenzoate synthetase component 1
MFAQPAATFRYRLGSDGRGRSEWIHARGQPARPPPMPFTHDPLIDLAGLMASTATPPTESGPLFTGGWIGWLGYDLGRVIEPAAGRHRPHHAGWPIIEWHRCPGALLIDRCSGEPRLVGDRQFVPNLSDPQDEPATAFQLGRLRSATGRQSYEASVSRAIEYIRAGDLFQVNLAHRLSAGFSGSARGFFASLAAATDPWHGAYIEAAGASGEPRRVVASASPELFLEFDPSTRRVITRPMKGTRPAAADPQSLFKSEKDLAELNMIIDLMRNDLGRVCEIGSVRVDQPRVIEHHGDASGTGVLQAVGTVSGTLRNRFGIADLLRAAFPGGSVTGAPKIRAMQIIGELEPEPRGPYCGCTGFVSDSGHAAFNIAIRTALLSGRPATEGIDSISSGTLDYSVGAGIVADSLPDAEWRETLDKAAAILALAGSGEP